MANSKDQENLSPAVLEVIENFTSSISSESDIDERAAQNLVKLLSRNAIPKPDELSKALFDVEADDTE